jgi:hypothetical protein
MATETAKNALSDTMRENILERDDHQCKYCEVGLPVATLEVHHIIPVSKGGRHVPDNLVTLCERCHKALHRLSAVDGLSCWILDVAQDEEMNTPDSPEVLQDKYSIPVPEHWDSEEWVETISELEVPARVYLNKKTIKGNEYYYFQWRDGDSVRSEYIGPANPS